mgnify:CR=1 FL=1
MKLKKVTPPRKFIVGSNKIEISHKLNLFLKDNEMITFITKDKNEYDVVKKDWGYYATPSINRRLRKNNFQTALVINDKKHIFIMLVEKSKKRQFIKYLKSEKNKVLLWLDKSYKIKN